MIKKLKLLILFLIQFLFLQGSYGQMQKNMTDYLSQRFLKYCKSVPREEIFVHTDRNAYISGEDMWFNIYLIDRQSFKPGTESKIAYFELLNQENLPIVQKRFLITEGCGPGQIVLPDSLSTGTYTIRAYTSWMKNFLPLNCFMKDIKVYNSFSTKTLKGKSYSGNTPHNGIGNDFSNRISLTGLSLKVNNLKPDTLELFINTSENFRSDNRNLLYLFIQTHGIMNHVSSEILADTNTKISIPRNQLLPGINQITVFNSKGKPVGERLVFNPDKEKPVITLHSADSSKIRNKISLDLEIGKQLSSTLNSANLSISVSPELNDHSFKELDDYMIFGTEFGLLPKEVIKDRKISEIAPEIADSLLQTMKSHWINWEMILADKLPDFKYQVEKEDHYLTGKLLTSDQKSPAPGKFLFLSTPGKVAVFQYAKTDQDGNFNFNVHIDEDLKDLIIQQEEVTKNKNVYLESSFSDQYFKYKKADDSISLAVPLFISNWSGNYQVRKIYGTSYIGDPIRRIISQPKPKRFYGKPEQELIMKDYVTLPVMQEVFFELLLGVFLKNNKVGYDISVADPETNKVYENLPLLLVDGVVIKDASVIAGLDPEIVEKVDVVRTRYLIGDYMTFGIVNVITKAGDFSNAALPDDATRLSYRVIDPVLSFVSPDYSSEKMRNNRIPDLRNTLYWNPSLKPDKDGKVRIEFWTSDIVSDYEINVQGITSDGKLISVKKIIIVK